MPRLAPAVLAVTAALSGGTALAASDVGIPVGPVGDVPTETLPAGPEEAAVAPDAASTWPPRPPSPPFGPPNSMNFSRRKLDDPAPPSPLRTYTLAWSRNRMGVE